MFVRCTSGSAIYKHNNVFFYFQFFKKWSTPAVNGRWSFSGLRLETWEQRLYLTSHESSLRNNKHLMLFPEA